MRPAAVSSRANFSVTGVLPAARRHVPDRDDLATEREAAEHADAVEEVAHRDDGAEHARDAGEEPEDHPHPRGLVLVRPRLLDDLHERVFKPLDVVDLLLLQFNFPFFSS